MNPDTSLDGRTILVTGAAQGIGLAIAQTALARGANVVAVDLQADALALAGDRVLTLPGSVTDAAFAQHALDAAVQRFGAVHGRVNNAGIVRAALIEKMSLQAWQQVLDVHLSGPFYFLQAVGRHLIERAKAGDAAPGSMLGDDASYITGQHLSANGGYTIGL